MTKQNLMALTLILTGLGASQPSLAAPGDPTEGASAWTGTSENSTVGRSLPACDGQEAALTADGGPMFVSTLRPAAYPATMEELRFHAAGFGATAAYDCDPTAPFHVRVWSDRAAFPASEPPADTYESTVVAGPDGVVRVELPTGLTLSEGELLFVAVRTMEVTVGSATFGSCVQACPSVRPDLLQSTSRQAPFVWRSLEEPLAMRLEVSAGLRAFARAD
ncbi:MAG: hypothetical protein AAF447_19760 [Myxococcota bacterium]